MSGTVTTWERLRKERCELVFKWKHWSDWQIGQYEGLRGGTIKLSEDFKTRLEKTIAELPERLYTERMAYIRSVADSDMKFQHDPAEKTEATIAAYLWANKALYEAMEERRDWQEKVLFLQMVALRDRPLK